MYEASGEYFMAFLPITDKLVSKHLNVIETQKR